VSVYIVFALFFYALTQISNRAGKPPQAHPQYPGEGEKPKMDETIELTEAEEQKIREEARAEVFDGKEPVVDETPASTQPEGTNDVATPDQDGAAAEKDVDEWAGVNPAVRKQLETISQKVGTLDAMEGRLKQTERRIGSIQNEFHNANQAAKEVEDAPSKAEMAAAAEDDKAWDELKEDFPEWATAVENKIAAASAGFKQPDVSDIRENLSSVKDSMVTSEVFEKRLVNLMHPGYEQTIQSPEYTDWITKQPEDVQQKANYGTTADDAVHVLNLFKQSTVTHQKTPEEIAAARDKRLENSISTPSGPKSRPPKSEADMSEQELRQTIAKEEFGDNYE